MPNLKNVSGGPLYLGVSDGMRVEDGQVLSIEGDVSDDSPDDAYLVGDRLWPKAIWKATGGKPSDTPDVTKES